MLMLRDDQINTHTHTHAHAHAHAPRPRSSPFFLCRPPSLLPTKFKIQTNDRRPTQHARRTTHKTSRATHATRTRTPRARSRPGFRSKSDSLAVSQLVTQSVTHSAPHPPRRANHKLSAVSSSIRGSEQSSWQRVAPLPSPSPPITTYHHPSPPITDYHHLSPPITTTGHFFQPPTPARVRAPPMGSASSRPLQKLPKTLSNQHKPPSSILNSGTPSPIYDLPIQF